MNTNIPKYHLKMVWLFLSGFSRKQDSLRLTDGSVRKIILSLKTSIHNTFSHSKTKPVLIKHSYLLLASILQYNIWLFSLLLRLGYTAIIVAIIYGTHARKCTLLVLYKYWHWCRCIQRKVLVGLFMTAKWFDVKNVGYWFYQYPLPLLFVND